MNIVLCFGKQTTFWIHCSFQITRYPVLQINNILCTGTSQTTHNLMLIANDLQHSSVANPVGGEEGEVEWLGDTILAGLHCIHIPTSMKVQLISLLLILPLHPKLHNYSVSQ